MEILPLSKGVKGGVGEGDTEQGMICGVKLIVATAMMLHDASGEAGQQLNEVDLSQRIQGREGSIALYSNLNISEHHSVGFAYLPGASLQVCQCTCQQKESVRQRLDSYLSLSHATAHMLHC